MFIQRLLLLTAIWSMTSLHAQPKNLLLPGNKPIEKISTYPGPFPRYWEGEEIIHFVVTGPKENQKLAVKASYGFAKSAEQATRLWGCSDCSSPRAQRQFLELTIKRNNQVVTLPVKTYNDLVDPHPVTSESFSIDRDNSNVWYLTINGADAGESYTARLTFEDNRYVKREVWSRAFPEFGAQVYE